MHAPNVPMAPWAVPAPPAETPWALRAYAEGEPAPLAITMIVPEGVAPGSKLLYTTPDGEELRLTVAEGVPPGSVMTLTQDPNSRKWNCEAEPPSELEASLGLPPPAPQELVATQEVPPLLAPTPPPPPVAGYTTMAAAGGLRPGGAESLLMSLGCAPAQAAVAVQAAGGAGRVVRQASYTMPPAAALPPAATLALPLQQRSGYGPYVPPPLAEAPGAAIAQEHRPSYAPGLGFGGLVAHLPPARPVLDPSQLAEAVRPGLSCAPPPPQLPTRQSSYAPPPQEFILQAAPQVHSRPSRTPPPPLLQQAPPPRPTFGTNAAGGPSITTLPPVLPPAAPPAAPLPPLGPSECPGQAGHGSYGGQGGAPGPRPAPPALAPAVALSRGPWAPRAPQPCFELSPIGLPFPMLAPQLLPVPWLGAALAAPQPEQLPLPPAFGGAAAAGAFGAFDAFGSAAPGGELLLQALQPAVALGCWGAAAGPGAGAVGFASAAAGLRLAPGYGVASLGMAPLARCQA